MPSGGEVAAAAGGGGGGGGAGQPGQQQQQQNPLMSVIRMVMFWYLFNNFFGKKGKVDPAMLMKNVMSKGEELDMWVYLSEEEVFANFQDESALIWQESNIPYAEYGPHAKRTAEFTYYPSKAVQQNGTIFAHVFFCRSGFPPDPEDPSFHRSQTFSRTHPLVSFHPPPKASVKKKLLDAAEDDVESNEVDATPAATAAAATPAASSSSSAASDSDDDDDAAASLPPLDWVSYWKPNLTLLLVDDFSSYVRGKVPDLFSEYMLYDYDTGNYFPPLVASDFWLLKDKLILVNETVESLPLSMTVESVSMWKWKMYLGMEQSFKMQMAYGAAMESEGDEIKRVFLEGNPVLLAITVVVSMLHSVFDFLAFKNDIQFWNKNKSMEGLSARSIVINFACQVIVFLYLLDNDTSWMIIISAGISCAIEFWKIGKAMHIEIDRSGRIPLLRFRDRDSYAKNKTKEYDEIATRYLSYALYPLMLGYAIYSLIYESHKSWYSWILSSLTGCVYTFGFIMMCPQLFINYKLKSVAHLPWRQMTYKFLNTIIDDLFAFVIKMPTLHRLSVFRDDVIFLIYIYQRWVYPVDKKRVNEFGFGGEEIPSAGSAEGPPVAAIEGSAEGDEKKEDDSELLETSVKSKAEGLTQRGRKKTEAEEEKTSTVSEGKKDS